MQYSIKLFYQSFGGRKWREIWWHHWRWPRNVLLLRTSKALKNCDENITWLASPMLQRPGRFLGIIGKYPTPSKSNHLHVDIFQNFLSWIGVHSLNSSQMIGNCPEVLNFNMIFLKLNWFVCNYTKYSNKCVLQFKVKQRNNVLGPLHTQSWRPLTMAM
jgi:hypothetical protein